MFSRLPVSQNYLFQSTDIRNKKRVKILRSKRAWHILTQISETKKEWKSSEARELGIFSHRYQKQKKSENPQKQESLAYSHTDIRNKKRVNILRSKRAWHILTQISETKKEWKSSEARELGRFSPWLKFIHIFRYHHQTKQNKVSAI
jgi:nucleoid DNA-binding protein